MEAEARRSWKSRQGQPLCVPSPGQALSGHAPVSSRQGWGHRNPAWCSGTPEPSLPAGAFSARITWDRITQLNMGRGVSLGRAGGRRWGLSEASPPESAFGGPVSRNVVPSRIGHG